MALHKTYQLYLQGSAHIYIVVQLNTGCFLFTKLYCSFAIKADGLPRQGQVCCNAPSQKLCRCSTDDTVRSDLFIKYSTTAGILWTTLQCKKKKELGVTVVPFCHTRIIIIYCACFSCIITTCLVLLQHDIASPLDRRVATA